MFYQYFNFITFTFFTTKISPSISELLINIIFCVFCTGIPIINNFHSSLTCLSSTSNINIILTHYIKVAIIIPIDSVHDTGSNLAIIRNRCPIIVRRYLPASYFNGIGPVWKMDAFIFTEIPPARFALGPKNIEGSDKERP